MQTISITELQNNIGAYLEQVREGLELVIESDSQPIARITPIDSDQIEERKLVAAGVLRVPEMEDLPEDFWNEVKEESALLSTIIATVRTERDED